MTRKSSLEAMGNAQLQSCPSFKASFRLSPNKRLQVFFLKRNIPAYIVREHFANGMFEMPSPFDLPPDVLDYLGLDKYRIQSGHYTVHEDCDFYKLEL